MTAPTATGPDPLTPEDFDALDAELDMLREQDDEIPQWEFCEGFLAALDGQSQAVLLADDE